MTLLSVFYFWEYLNSKEFIGIIVGVSIPLFLINKSEKKVQNNLKLGLFYIIVTTVTAWVGSFFSKILHSNDLDIDLYMFIWFLSGIFIAGINYKLGQKKWKVYSTKGVYRLWVVLWIITFFSMYTYTYALAWNLAIAVTINSFSILIPIILSVIFYKEEMTWKKALVIWLSIVSVILFI